MNYEKRRVATIAAKRATHAAVWADMKAMGVTVRLAPQQRLAFVVGNLWIIYDDVRCATAERGTNTLDSMYRTDKVVRAMMHAHKILGELHALPGAERVVYRFNLNDQHTVDDNGEVI